MRRGDLSLVADGEHRVAGLVELAADAELRLLGGRRGRAAGEQKRSRDQRHDDQAVAE